MDTLKSTLQWLLGCLGVCLWGLKCSVCMWLAPWLSVCLGEVVSAYGKLKMQCLFVAGTKPWDFMVRFVSGTVSSLYQKITEQKTHFPSTHDPFASQNQKNSSHRVPRMLDIEPKEVPSVVDWNPRACGTMTDCLLRRGGIYLWEVKMQCLYVAGTCPKCSLRRSSLPSRGAY